LLSRRESLHLDPIDQRIIALLQEDARSSYAEIGERVALSAPAVKATRRRLRSSGVIRGYTALIEPGAVGWTTEAFVEVFCTGRTRAQQLRAAANGIRRWSAPTPSPARPTRWSNLRAVDMAGLEEASTNASVVQPTRPVDQRGIAADHSAGSEPVDASLDGGRRQRDPLADLRIR